MGLRVEEVFHAGLFLGSLQRYGGLNSERNSRSFVGLCRDSIQRFARTALWLLGEERGVSTEFLWRTCTKESVVLGGCAESFQLRDDTFAGFVDPKA